MKPGYGSARGERVSVMLKAKPENGETVSSASLKSGTSLHHLMRAIVALTRSLNASQCVPSTDEDAEHILFDFDFDGARYVLIKMPSADRKSVPLSPRELEIVRMVAQGHQNKVIAVVLNISSWTVCTHLRRIFAKLGVSSRAAMVARLTEFGPIAEQRISLDQPVPRDRANRITVPPTMRREQPAIGAQIPLEPTQSLAARSSHRTAERNGSPPGRSPGGGEPQPAYSFGSKPQLSATRPR
jgi:DNA-binding CsgD family transcriptional regulator